MYLSGIRTIKGRPLYNPPKNKEHKKAKYTEEGKHFLSIRGKIPP